MSHSDEVFDDTQRRTARLWERLAQASTVSITGVVSPFGAGGHADGQSDVWTLTFSFEHWRENGNQVNNRHLAVRKRMTHDELGVFMCQIEPYQVIQIRARLVVDSEFESTQAELMELIGVSEDQELQQLSVKLLEPVTIQDERFGTLTLDRRLDRFDAITRWNGCEIKLSLEAANASDCTSATVDPVVYTRK